MAVYAGPDIVEDGLVLCLDARNFSSYPGSGVTWGDLSTNNNNARILNGTAFTNENGGGFVFDGSNDYINVTENANLTPQVLTVDVFAKINSDTNLSSQSQYQNLLFRQNTRTSNFEGYQLVYEETNRRFRAFTGTSAGAVSTVSSLNNSAPLGSIRHVSVVFDTTLQSIYVNGQLHSSGAKATGIDYNATHSLDIGGMNTPVGWNFQLNGTIYCIKIYNRALSAAEISQNFNSLRGRYNL